MKRLLITLLILFALYYGVQIVFRIQSNGFSDEYTINTDNKEYKIKEVYTANQKDENNSYYITIDYNGNKYSFQSYKDYNKSSNIIKNIYSYNNCIYPEFRDDKGYFDITCIKNGVQEYYHNIKGTDSGLDAFAKSLESKGYSASNYSDTGSLTEYDKTISINTNNIVNNHYFALVNYKGLYTMNVNIPNKIYRISLFNKDVYEPTISTFLNEYYVIANYNTSYSYSSAYIVNIKTNSIRETDFKSPISSRAYIEGTQADSAYVLDYDNSVQYEINTKSSGITQVGNDSTKYKYFDGKDWSYISLADSMNKKYFASKEKTSSDSTYARIDTIGGTKTGFKYYYKQVGSVYKCYKSNASDNILTYLFDTTSINQIAYIDDYVYYLNGNNINYYQDGVGIKTIASDNEINFNKYVRFYIYK